MIGPIRAWMTFEVGNDAAHRVEYRTLFPPVAHPGDLQIDPKGVRITVPDVGVFTGRRVSDNELRGVLETTGGAAQSVALIRHVQTPRPPFPYEVEAIAYPGSRGDRISATLTRPCGRARAPAVVLVAGSEPTDRDNYAQGHRPFAVLADRLTRAGFAVVRYDQPGVGASSGSYGAATVDDFVAAAAGAIRFLRARPDIDARHIGLIGFSAGGLVATLAADRDPDLAWLVLLSSPAILGEDNALAQARWKLEASGMPARAVEARLAFDRQAYEIARSDADEATARHRLDTLAAQAPEGAPGPLAEMLALPWRRFLIRFDPGVSLTALRCPTLALYGARDRLVAANANAPAMRRALAHGRVNRVEVLEGLNHQLQPSRSGSLEEAAQIPVSLAPGVEARIVQWARAWGSSAPRPPAQPPS